MFTFWQYIQRERGKGKRISAAATDRVNNEETMMNVNDLDDDEEFQTYLETNNNNDNDKKMKKNLVIEDSNVGRIDPNVRDELTADILSTTTDSKAELQELQESLEKARKEHAKAKASKDFVQLRFQHYKKLLQQQRHQLQQATTTSADDHDNVEQHSNQEPNQNKQEDDEEDDEEDDDDVTEEPSFVPKRNLSLEEIEKWQSTLDEKELALSKVADTLKSLEMNCKALQRRIWILERRQSEIQNMTMQCRAFVVAAASVEQQQQFDAHQDEQDNDEEKKVPDCELELTPVVSDATKAEETTTTTCNNV